MVYKALLKVYYWKKNVEEREKGERPEKYEIPFTAKYKHGAQEMADDKAWKILNRGFRIVMDSKARIYYPASKIDRVVVSSESQVEED